MRWGFARHDLIVELRYQIPLWPLAAGSFLATAIAWRLDTLAHRRARGGVNLCPKCTYDRTGLAADAKCPECGALPPSGP